MSRFQTLALVSAPTLLLACSGGQRFGSTSTQFGSELTDGGTTVFVSPGPTTSVQTRPSTSVSPVTTASGASTAQTGLDASVLGGTGTGVGTDAGGQDVALLDAGELGADALEQGSSAVSAVSSADADVLAPGSGPSNTATLPNGGDATDVASGSGADDSGASDGVVPADPVDAATEPVELPLEPAVCNAGDFGAPRLVRGLDGVQTLWGPAISPDGLTLYFGSTGNNEDLFSATRTGLGERVFSNVTALAGLNTDRGEGTPFLSASGLSLYFYSNRDGGQGDRDLWWARRSDSSASFKKPELVRGVNTPDYEHLPWVSDDELTLYYTALREGGVGQSDIWGVTRESVEAEFGGHHLLAGINSASREDSVAFSPDRLTVYFSSDRRRNQDLDLWMATRPSEDAEFSGPVALENLNSDAEDSNIAITRDGKEMYFSSGRDGQQRIWVTARTCNETL